MAVSSSSSNLCSWRPAYILLETSCLLMQASCFPILPNTRCHKQSARQEVVWNGLGLRILANLLCNKSGITTGLLMAWEPVPAPRREESRILFCILFPPDPLQLTELNSKVIGISLQYCLASLHLLWLLIHLCFRGSLFSGRDF